MPRLNLTPDQYDAYKALDNANEREQFLAYIQSGNLADQATNGKIDYSAYSNIELNTRKTDKLLNSGKMNGIVLDREISNNNRNSKFIVTPHLDIHNKIKSAKEILFFTKPDFNLFKDDYTLVDQLKGQPEFVDAWNRNSYILNYLSYKSRFSSPFIPLLTNTVRNTIDLPDISMTLKESVKNTFGTRISHRGDSEQSDEMIKFNLEFEDDRFNSVYTLFDIWDRYSSLKTLGICDPKEEYDLNGVLDDWITIYKIVLAEDMRTILKIFELVACAPENVPRSSFSEVKGGPMLYNISWTCQFINRSEADAVFNFNTLAKTMAGNTMPSRRKKYVGPVVYNLPYIHTSFVENRWLYSLEWSDHNE